MLEPQAANDVIFRPEATNTDSVGWCTGGVKSEVVMNAVQNSVRCSQSVHADVVLYIDLDLQVYIHRSTVHHNYVCLDI